MGIDNHYPQSTGGRPLKWSPEMVERVLWEVALQGGQIRKARQNILDAERAKVSEALEAEGHVIEQVEVPGETTISDWIKGRFRDRYAEILQTKKEQLDDVLAARATGFALQMEDAKEAALRRTIAGIGSANGIEASMILRNVVQAQAQSAGVAAQVRDGQRFEEENRGLRELATSLARFGGVKVIEATRDVTLSGEDVVDVTDAEQLPAP